MNSRVVDTNVPLVANGKSHASPECVLTCVETLQHIQQSGLCVVLDEGFRILGEYHHQLNPKGQPGVGDAFLRWLHQNLANPAVCEIVSLTPRPEDPNNFVEFPDDPALQGFDPSDRKFVAVALASPQHPEILNAVDTDWWQFREALQACGVIVQFLCPVEMEAVKGETQAQGTPKRPRRR